MNQEQARKMAEDLLNMWPNKGPEVVKKYLKARDELSQALLEVDEAARREEREACAVIGDAIDAAAARWEFRTNCGELIRARSSKGGGV